MLQWLLDQQQAATLIFTGVVAASTVVYAVLTWRLVSETRHMRRAQTEPKIAVYVEPREEFPNFAHLYVKNIGLGPAYNISFDITVASESTGAQGLIDDFTRSRFLITGLSYLGPGQRIQSAETTFREHLQEKLNTVLFVKVRYRDAGSRWHTDTYTLGMAEFDGFGGLGRPHLYEIAQSVKKMQEDIGRLATGVRRLRVDVFDQDDREREMQEHQERRAEQLKSHGERESPADDEPNN